VPDPVVGRERCFEIFERWWSIWSTAKHSDEAELVAKSADLLPCKVTHAQDGDAYSPGRKRKLLLWY
jgi:hypothetical protein